MAGTCLLVIDPKVCVYLRTWGAGGRGVSSRDEHYFRSSKQNDHMNITIIIIIIIFLAIIMRIVTFPISYIRLFGDHFLSGEYV